LRIVSVERGHDARSFSLVAFGGAGPMHAAQLATELGIREVIIPPIPGGFSALGLVATDLKRDYVKTHYTALAEADPAAVAAVYESMEAAAREMLRAADIPQQRWVLQRAADVRYSRQAYELTVPVTSGTVTGDTLRELAARFHDKHRTTYGHANPDEAVQLVNLRLVAIGRLEGLELRHRVSAGGDARRGTRAVWFKSTGRAECAIHHRDDLGGGGGGDGDRITGPAVIEALDTTIVVPPGWRASTNSQGHIIMEARDDGQ
jgi:N-methylhydantoinase A